MTPSAFYAFHAHSMKYRRLSMPSETLIVIQSPICGESEVLG